MENNKAYNRVQKLKKFYKNLMWFGIVTAVILGNDWSKSELESEIFGGHLLLAVWAMILSIKAISLFVFNEEWERKIFEKETAKN
ncbi:2TM domain-containing protein [Chryseobacterium sp.]|uniref:2TM domain-containing protein n=1 Tax=Chryseobacterium sp. TaxID=1871047 RepID=UPI00321A14D5